MSRRGANSGNRGQGSNWIRPEKRRAIYLRDGNVCVYCGASKQLSLDHIKPRSKGGSNCSTNLLTACVRDNVEKGDATLTQYVGAERARQLRKQARRPLVWVGQK